MAYVVLVKLFEIVIYLCKLFSCSAVCSCATFDDLYLCFYPFISYFYHNNIVITCSNKFVQVASQVPAGGQSSKEGTPFEEGSS